MITDRMCAIGITSDMSSRTALAAEFSREYKNMEFLWKQRAVIGIIAALRPAASQIPGKKLSFLVTKARKSSTWTLKIWFCLRHD